jgi:hypothetical protein
MRIDYNELAGGLTEEFPVRVECALIFMGTGVEFELPPDVAKWKILRGLKTVFMNGEAEWKEVVKWAEALRLCGKVHFDYRKVEIDGTETVVIREGNLICWVGDEGEYFVINFEKMGWKETPDGIVVGRHLFAPASIVRDLMYNS